MIFTSLCEAWHQQLLVIIVDLKHGLIVVYIVFAEE